MSRSYLVTLTLLLSLAVAAQTTPSTSQSGAPSPSAQATTPGAGTPSATAPTPAEPSAQDQARQTLDNVGAGLNLTADQKTKLQPILTEEIQLIHDLPADTSMTTEQKQAKFRDVMTADHAKIDAILTPEQKQKLSDMNRQRDAQHSGAPAPGAAPGPGAPTPSPVPAPSTTPGTSPNTSPTPTPHN